MIGQPPQDIGMLVRGVVVSGGMNDLAGWNGSHGVEETDKLAVVPLARQQHEAGQIAERIDQRHNLDGQAAARSANGLILRPPFAPAPC